MVGAFDALEVVSKIVIAGFLLVLLWLVLATDARRFR